MVILNPMSIDDERSSRERGVAVAYSRNRDEAMAMINRLQHAGLTPQVDRTCSMSSGDGTAILVGPDDFIAASDCVIDYLHEHQSDDTPFEDDDDDEFDDEFDNDDDFNDYGDEEDDDDEDYEEDDDF